MKKTKNVTPNSNLILSGGLPQKENVVMPKIWFPNVQLTYLTKKASLPWDPRVVEISI